ncbi:hypothetical protein DPMN_144313 [Dreissena polymorpha]|uniref:Uncharacterized protein n=1 Tax=Dreissena polymorpha TaxID=45954 RepID=A0A9D4JQ35_DREPO|nr:hypothetical protein DPMN_144313 [Dreissena polymorpha]
MCFLSSCRVHIRPEPPRAKWFLSLVALAEEALARLALYKRQMSLLSTIGPRRSASARTTIARRERKTYLFSHMYIRMLSSPSVPSKTGFYPCIGTVALSNTRKSQPLIDNRPRASLWKPPRRRSPPAAYTESTGRPRSQAETNGPMGPERDSPAITPRELDSPTRPARHPLP